MFGEWWFSQTKTYSFDQAFFKWDVDPFHPGLSWKDVLIPLLSEPGGNEKHSWKMGAPD